MCYFFKCPFPFLEPFCSYLKSRETNAKIAFIEIYERQ